MRVKPFYKVFQSIDIQAALSELKNKSGTEFDFKRVFSISEVPNNCVRGKHAHLDCYQYMACVNGSFNLTLKFQDQSDKKINLKAGCSILIGTLIWVEFTSISNSLMIVFCTHNYNEKEYIRNWTDFKD
tara:strand:- start:210 stop:596 length:387 start_codon:yes stop_codon:yes gene_type:complete